MPESQDEVILGWITENPDLYNPHKFPKYILKSDKQHRLISAIDKLLEKNSPIDIFTIQRESGLDFSYLSSLIEGLHRVDERHFEAYVQQLVEKYYQGELFKETEKQGKAYCDGVPVDLSKTKDIIAKIDQIESKSGELELTASTIEDLALEDISEIDWLVHPIVARHNSTLLGGIKGVGKSLLVNQLGLYAASGASPFISDQINIPKPCKVLLVQQEVSLPGMKNRFEKMRMEKTFQLEGRFRQKTTTGNWWSLASDDGLRKIKMLIEEHEPDILILDPLYTFAQDGVNRDQEIAPVISRISALKDQYNLGIIIVHHFTNKEDPNEPRHMSGRFMGSSMIANAADVLVAMDFLHPNYKSRQLPLPYNHYANIEITTRHGEWPDRITIERRMGELLFHKSELWQELGRLITPGQIADILAANDGEMHQKDLIEYFKDDATPSTVKRAIEEALNQGVIQKEFLPGRGNPAILRIRQ